MHPYLFLLFSIILTVPHRLTVYLFLRNSTFYIISVRDTSINVNLVFTPNHISSFGILSVLALQNHIICLSIQISEKGRKQQNASLSLPTLYSPAAESSIVLMSSRKKIPPKVALILYGCSSSKVIYLWPNRFSMFFHTDQGIL